MYLHGIKPHIHFPPSFLISVLVAVFLRPIQLPAGVRGSDTHEGCKGSFDCGKITRIGYPFWRSDWPEYCGHPSFALECDGGNLTLSYDSLSYRVNDVDASTQILTVSRTDLFGSLCAHEYGRNTSFDIRVFKYTPSDSFIAVAYGCDSSTENEQEGKPAGWLHDFQCSDNNFVVISHYPPAQALTGKCESFIKVPVLNTSKVLMGGHFSYGDAMAEAFWNGFELHMINENAWECEACRNSSRRCGYNPKLKEFTCLCYDGTVSKPCRSNRSIGKWIGIGVGTGAGFLVLMSALLFVLYTRRRKKYGRASVISRSEFSMNSSRIDFERGSFAYNVPIFDYDELAKATNNFDAAMELGDGGFGTVFKGKLRDGRVVAVKRLYEHNYKRLEQFMNEVNILAQVRHPNLISLYGCTSRQSSRLLLVYEYMSNGTVADHINGDLAKPGMPPWSTRLNIAVETAVALVYLHATDIVHRDLKTNNILLTDNFTVKVADFGLSRLFPLNVSHISTAPQGTPGYVDPEYHQCYQLTEKSDVYSFGVVLVELISSLPAVDITRHRHEINLSTLAINKIQANALHELVDANLGFQSDENTREMITAVAELAFQCLQPRHEERPSMQEVLETLQQIQKCGHKGEKPENVVDTSDDAVLLKNNPLMLSPDSVTTKWVSSSTTSTAPYASS